MNFSGLLMISLSFGQSYSSDPAGLIGAYMSLEIFNDDTRELGLTAHRVKMLLGAGVGSKRDEFTQ